MFRLLSILFFAATISVATAQTPLTTCSQMGIGQGASLNGFRPFPATDPFNENISTLPLSANSAAIIGALGSTPLHPDFGAGSYANVPLGMPYDVVSAQPFVPIHYTGYGYQSDQGPMPIPANAPVEAAGVSNADHHLLLLDQSNCFLYELYNASLQTDGSWNALSGAIWDLLADNARPYTWTSTDAAGLPVFPGLARYDEVAAGAINHALRFTVARSRNEWILPATHQASNSSSASYAPMGARFRLKASYNISGFTPQTRVILQALKTYGMIVADNGSNMYISGTNDSRWSNDDLHSLGSVPASAFEVVDTGTAYTDASAPTGPAPVIASFTASTVTTHAVVIGAAPGRPGTPMIVRSATPLAESTPVAAGTAVTLNWAATGQSYYVLTPSIGAVRGATATVNPTATTTYTLYANSHLGSTTKTITITVK